MIQEKKQRISRVRQALEFLQAGKIIMVRDDEDRENEGDFICAIEHGSPENVNFMAVHGRGLLCAAITRETASRLDLHPMEMYQAGGGQLGDAQGTAFTISVDATRGITTGISAEDRAETLKILHNPLSVPGDLRRPGHMFPLIAKDGGILVRRGHTEAAVDLTRLAGLQPGGLICEIMNPDGTMARGPELESLSEKWNMPLISLEDLLTYREAMGDVAIHGGPESRLPTDAGGFTIQVFKTDDPGCPEIIALSNKDGGGRPVVRLHSECLTGDSFGSQRCDCGNQLEAAKNLVQQNGGVILYLRQEGRGIGIFEKIRAYALQDGGLDTVDANLALGHGVDTRNFAGAVAVLRYLGFRDFDLLTNNPHKIAALSLGELFSVQPRNLELPVHPESRRYIETKIARMGHAISLKGVKNERIYEYY